MVQIFTALLLGLLTILDPCTLMTSITAIGYIDKEINNKRLVLTNGLMFVLGKLATYVLLSIPFLMGAQTEGIQHVLGHYGEPILAGFMLVCGVVLLYSGHHHHKHDHGISKWLIFPDDDRYHADTSEHMELDYADGVRFGNGRSYYADCMAGKLQRSEHRKPHQQDGSVRKMVPPYMRSAVPCVRRVSDDSLRD